MFYPLTEAPGGIIFTTIFILKWLQYFWVSYLRYRQWKNYSQETKDCISISKILELEIFEKARCEAKKQLKLSFIKESYEHITTVVWMLTLKDLWEICGDALVQEGLEASEAHQIFLLLAIFVTIDNLFGFVGAIISKVLIADGGCKIKSILCASSVSFR